MLLENKIKIKINNKTLKYFKEKGYSDINNGDIININVCDLPKYSRQLIKVKCDNCELEKNVIFSDYNKITHGLIHKYYCKDCKSKKTKESNLNKYGVENVFQLDDIKEKIKKTNIKKYGTTHHLKNSEILEKQKQTNLDKYGVEYLMKSQEFKEKQKKTNIEKYGTEYSFLNDDVKEKIKKTNLEKYGYECAFKNLDIIDKIKKSKSLNIMSKYDEYRIVKIVDKEYTLHCDKCDKDFIIDSQSFRNRIRYKTILCTNCNPLNSYCSSGLEIEMREFIKNNCNNIILENNKSIIQPNELDIYIPDLKLAFEFNGVYWHNELNKEHNYHLNKTEMCELKGIQLIHIYEDDWLYKKNIVKSIILNKLGKSDKIYARKTEIREVTNNKIVRDFLDNNHIQGFVGSKIKIGLFYNDELVNLMTFGNRRISMGKKLTKYGEYELLRFCNKLNTNVVGGASKLFKYFVDTYKPEEIITYADRSNSQGKLYETLGFNYIGKTEPNYYYVVDSIRNNRFNFRKDQLIKQGFDKNKTEHEIMLERKIYRIYDSGNLKFDFKKQKREKK